MGASFYYGHGFFSLKNVSRGIHAPESHRGQRSRPKKNTHSQSQQSAASERGMESSLVSTTGSGTDSPFHRAGYREVDAHGEPHTEADEEAEEEHHLCLSPNVAIQ